MLLPPRNMENRGEGIAVMKKALRKQGKYLREILISVRECGQSVVIYALILAVVTAASAGALLSLKNNVNTTMDRAEQRIANTDIGSEESYIAVEVLQNIVVTVEDYAGSYDGDSHSGTVTVSAPVSGYGLEVIHLKRRLRILRSETGQSILRLRPTGITAMKVIFQSR